MRVAYIPQHPVHLKNIKIGNPYIFIVCGCARFGFVENVNEGIIIISKPTQEEQYRIRIEHIEAAYNIVSSG